MIPHPSTVHLVGDLHRKELLAISERERLAAGCFRTPADAPGGGMRRSSLGAIVVLGSFVRIAMQAVASSRPELR
jgi:hypothetical protein